MNIEKLLLSLSSSVRDVDVRAREPMSEHTTFRIGGPADLFCLPGSADALADVLAWARAEALPVFILGGGSNLLVRDGGIRGVVVSTARLSAITHREDGLLEAECGAPLARLAAYARDKSLTGLEFAQGIPGSVGGGVYMNAGAYGGEIKASVTETDAVLPSGELIAVIGEDHRFGYRESVFAENGAVVLRTRLRLEHGDSAEIAALMEDYRERRRSKQPLEFASAGSTFKRPPGMFAGQLIESAGLKGLSVGAAEISTKHAGFLINRGGASAQDVLELIGQVRERVRHAHGVLLEPEVRIVGDD